MRSYPSESLDLLRQIKGCRILRMVRLFRGDMDRFLKDFPRTRESELFARSGFSLFVEFEKIGWLVFTERERDISITLSRLNALPPLPISLALTGVDSQKYIECTDEKHSEPYWRNYVGGRIDDIKIITLSIDRENIRPFRNERGLWFVDQKGNDLIIQTSLAKKGIPGGLNIIRQDEIRDDVVNDLVICSI
jgi:hypothetical protein